MTNEYSFICPIKKEGVRLEDCEKIHSQSMQGKHSQIEDKICALAHLCWMCPTRNAFRVGGPWSHYDTKPFSDKPQESRKLPRDLVVYSLAHSIPISSDYRRCGMRGDDVGMHTDLFRDLQSSVMSEAPSVSKPSVSNAPIAKRKTPSRKTVATVKKESEKPKSATDALTYDKNEMANAVTELARKEQAAAKSAQNAPVSATKPAATHDKQTTHKVPQRAATGAPESNSKPMTLAERAKQMKAKGN